MESYESLFEGAYRKLEGREFPSDYSRRIHAINAVLSGVFIKQGGLEKELERADLELRFSGGMTEEGISRRLKMTDEIAKELTRLRGIIIEALKESRELSLRRPEGLEPRAPEQYTS